MHGRVRAHETRDGRMMGGLDRIATLVKQERQAAPELILLDDGDTIQGDSQSFLFKGAPIIECMNALRYDAMAIGNHEFNFGQDVLALRKWESSFPWLSANVLRETPGGGPFNPAPPYVILERRGVLIGVLGLTVDDVPNWEQPDYIRGLRFEPIVSQAKVWVPRLRPLCDVLVVLAHTGVEPRPGERRPDAGAAGADIALACPEIDVLICGHRHVAVESREVNGVLLTEAGSWSEYLGKVTLEVEKAASSTRVVSRKSQLIPVTSDIRPDPDIERVLEPFEKRWKEWAGEVVGRTAKPIDFRSAQTGPTAAVDLIHDAMKWATGADITLHVAFNDTTVIPAGPVTNQQVFEMYEYDNALWVLKITGRQLKDCLEDGLSGYGTWRFLTAGGIRYALDASRPRGERLLWVKRGGALLPDDAVLSVAINHYNAVAGGEHSLFRRASECHVTGKWVRDVIAGYIRSKGTVTPQVRSWFTVSGRMDRRPAAAHN